MHRMDDPELKALAESLPSIVLRSKAPATVKKYAGGFGRWKKWADSKHNIDAFPAKPFQFSLYLAFLTQQQIQVHQSKKRSILSLGHIRWP